MFLELKHTKLDVFVSARKFVLECYKITKHLPADEKFGMISQIRRAALSVNLNIAEGCSRKSSAERCRYFEIARGSLIEIDTAIGIAVELSYINKEQLINTGDLLVHTFKLLSGMILNSATHH